MVVTFVKNSAGNWTAVVSVQEITEPPSPEEVLASFQPTTDDIANSFQATGISGGVTSVSVNGSEIVIGLGKTAPPTDPAYKANIIKGKKNFLFLILEAIKTLNPNLKNYTLDVTFTKDSTGEYFAKISVAPPPSPIVAGAPSGLGTVTIGGIIGGIVVLIVIIIIIIVATKKQPKSLDDSYVALSG